MLNSCSDADTNGFLPAAATGVSAGVTDGVQLLEDATISARIQNRASRATCSQQLRFDDCLDI